LRFFDILLFESSTEHHDGFLRAAEVAIADVLDTARPLVFRFFGGDAVRQVRFCGEGVEVFDPVALLVLEYVGLEECLEKFLGLASDNRAGVAERERFEPDYVELQRDGGAVDRLGIGVFEESVFIDCLGKRLATVD